MSYVGGKSEVVEGQRLAERRQSSVGVCRRSEDDGVVSDAMEGEDMASALMLCLCCSDWLSLDLWGWNK